MRTASVPSAVPSPEPSGALADLRARLSEAEETLRAIRSGEVDAVVVAGEQGPQVFTLQGAEHAYRVLIESMNEGALTLTADATILYANQCFARMVKCPLERVMGSSLRRFLAAGDRATLRPLLRRADECGSKTQVQLRAEDGSLLSVQVSVRPLAPGGSSPAILGMVVTDLTEARRTEELLRALTQRVVQVQEAERARVALVLHDHITQLLCAILFRSQVLARRLSARGSTAKAAAMELCGMLSEAAEEAERLARNLRPSVLAQLGLVAVLHNTSTEFAARTGVPVKLTCARLTARLPADVELALYRIFQESVENVEKHAHAHQVTVRLRRQDNEVRLVVKDDGVGFDPKQHLSRREAKDGLGLLSMTERATYVGGALKVSSARGAGTEVEVRIPLPPAAPSSSG